MTVRMRQVRPRPSGQRGSTSKRSRAALGDAALQPHRRGERDHRAVVGAQRQLGVVHPRRRARAARIESLAQMRLAPTPPATTSRSSPLASQCGHRLVHQHVDDRRLRRRGQIGPVLLAHVAAALAQLRHHCRLQAGEREVEVAAVQQRPRQIERRRIAERRQPRERRPTGIRQTHHLGRLVEGLAGRVVDGLAEQRVAPHVVDAHQLRVPARDEQRDERKARRIGREKRRQQVAFEVVHAERRLAERRGERTGDARADEQRPGQARAARVGNDVDSVERRAAPRPAPGASAATRGGCGRARPVRAPRRHRRSCMSTWLCSACASSVGTSLPCARTSATPVSSQEDSMPRTTMGRVYSAACAKHWPTAMQREQSFRFVCRRAVAGQEGTVAG